MHIVIELKTLQAAIYTVIKSLPSKPTLSILEGVYMNAQNNEVLLRCSDLTLQIDTIFDADILEEGCIVLPGRLFSEVIRKLDGDMVEIRTDDRSVLIKYGRSKMNLQFSKGSEYPDMGIGDEIISLRIPQIVLKDMIRQTVFATAQEDTKPILMGVLCEINESNFSMVALDGFRLALRKYQTGAVFNNYEAVVPAKSLTEIARTLMDIEENVHLLFSKTHLSLDMGHTKIVSRLLDGDYIRYRSILPAEHKTRVRVNKARLLDSIERAILMAREGNNNLMKINVDEKILTVYATSALGNMEEEIEIALSGDPIQIAFNARYFTDSLKALNVEEIYIDMNNNVSPCVVRPTQGDDFYYLILPVRIFT
jgi:DNA polymerase-3 subunit beta